jgi:hypothetical protein
MAGAGWIPWVLLCVSRVTAGRPGSAAILGAVFGAQVLAGSADMCAMTVLASVLFVSPPDYVRLWRAWFTSIAIALTLSAGVWLPASEVVLHSARAALPEATRTFWSLHPLAVLELFLPLPLSALPFRPEWRDSIFDSREPFLGSVFLGTALLPLCLAALVDVAVPRVIRLGSFLGASGGFLIALGKNASAYVWAVTLIPPLKILRFPSKAMVPAAILICALAGVGAAAIRRSSRARRAASAGILSLAAVALALAGPLLGPFAQVFLDPNEGALISAFWRDLPPHLLGSVALLGLLAACIRWPSGKPGAFFATLLVLGHLSQSYSLHAEFNRTVPSQILEYRPETLPLLRAPNDGRLYVYDYELFGGMARKHLGVDEVRGAVAPSGPSRDVADLISSRTYLTPLVGAFFGLEYAWDGDLRLMFDARLADLAVGIRRLEGTPGFLRLLQISGVSRVAARHERGMEGLKLIARRKIGYGDDLRVFEVPESLPRAFLTSGRIRGTGSDLRDLLGTGIDPTRTVLVDDGPARDALPGFVGQARVTARKADRLTVETSASAAAFLTVLEGIMPGWRVWVDGRSATLERANAIFIGTEVPAGRHQVEFRFLPTSAVVGVCLSGLTAALLFFFGLLSLQTRATPRPGHAPA